MLKQVETRNPLILSLSKDEQIPLLFPHLLGAGSILRAAGQGRVIKRA